jgi:acyl carrier protein
MMTRAEATNAIHDFLCRDRREITKIDPDMDLLDSRVLDSLRFMNLILMIEQLTGKEVPLDRTTADDFRSIRRIQLRFFGLS